MQLKNRKSCELQSQISSAVCGEAAVLVVVWKAGWVGQVAGICLAVELQQRRQQYNAAVTDPGLFWAINPAVAASAVPQHVLFTFKGFSAHLYHHLLHNGNRAVLLYVSPWPPWVEEEVRKALVWPWELHCLFGFVGVLGATHRSIIVGGKQSEVISYAWGHTWFLYYVCFHARVWNTTHPSMSLSGKRKP